MYVCQDTHVYVTEPANESIPVSQSLTAAAIQRRHNPVADVALYNPPEIMARLAGVPVYTVVNRKNEFVLASGFEVRIQSLA